MARHHHRAVVRREHPRQIARRRLLIGVLILMATGVAYYLGHRHGNFAYVPMTSSADQLRGRLVELETQLDVEARATAELREQLAESRGSIDELERELSFYREVMAPEEVEDGVVLRAPVLRSGDLPGYWRYQLVAQRGGGGRSVYKGDLQATLRGNLSGVPHSVTFAELDESLLTDTFNLSFRYFQRFEGTLVMPPGFEPSRVVLAAAVSTPENHDVETSYAWQDVAVSSRSEDDKQASAPQE